MLVGVYGSLRKGEGNHRLIERYGSALVGVDYLTTPHTMYSLGAFPCICKSHSPKTQRSIVEVYEIVSDQMLESLDQLEGNGRFYTRELVKLEKGTEAWVYFVPESNVDHEHLEVVESGDWSKFLQKRGYR